MGSSGGGGGGTSTTVQNADPWKGQQPYLTAGFAQAQNLLNKGGPQYYSGQNYINQSPETLQALQATMQRAQQGSPTMGLAARSVNDTLAGKYLTPDSNPYLGQYFQQGVNSALPSLSATFSNAGRTGAQAQSQGMADMYGAMGRDIYGGAYNNERNLQMQALGMAPAIAANDYQDLAKQAAVGQAYDQQAQNVLNANMERWNFNQERPYSALDRYMQQIAGNYGQSTNSTTKNPATGGNPIGGALGGAMAGGSILGPWGALGGGLLGLLGGL